jgi:hypothetical protein
MRTVKALMSGRDVWAMAAMRAESRPPERNRLRGASASRREVTAEWRRSEKLEVS